MYKSVPNGDKGEEVKKSEDFVDIINGSPKFEAGAWQQGRKLKHRHVRVNESLTLLKKIPYKVRN